MELHYFVSLADQGSEQPDYLKSPVSLSSSLLNWTYVNIILGLSHAEA